VNVYSKKDKEAQYFTTNLSKTHYETSVIALVASFEKVVFAKYKTSYGTIKGIVGLHSKTPLDYYKSREKFVYGKIDKLYSIIELIKGQVDTSLLDNLKKIKEQRDYLAHGKRFSATTIDIKLEDIAYIFNKFIYEIEN
jgi:hypothetical protein